MAESNNFAENITQQISDVFQLSRQVGMIATRLTFGVVDMVSSALVSVLDKTLPPMSPQPPYDTEQDDYLSRL